MNRSIPRGERVAWEWGVASVGVTLGILHDCFYGVDANREKLKSKNICIKKNVSFGELLTAWHEKKRVGSRVPRQSLLKSGFLLPSLYVIIEHACTKLWKIKDQEKGLPSLLPPSSLPHRPHFRMYSSKRISCTFTHVYLYQDSRLHVPPSPRPPRKLLSVHTPAPYGERLSIL